MKLASMSTAAVLLVVPLASLRPSPEPAVSGNPIIQDEDSKGDCCLCTLSYDGEAFTWSCPCSAKLGSTSCSIDDEGCTNVGVCPKE
jgi:hypothetical protein